MISNNTQKIVPLYHVIKQDTLIENAQISLAFLSFTQPLQLDEGMTFR